MFTIGMTGGIGSGKSTVCAVFKTLGIPVFDADTEAKKLYDEDKELKHQIIALFGEEVYHNEIFDRKKMAALVFHSPEKLNMLNAIIHPLVLIQFKKWALIQQSPYVIKEAALLIESGSYKQLDKLILVSCPVEKRIERVMKRDAASREDILLRINKQATDDEKRKFCQYEIVNDGSEMVIPQVLKIDQAIQNSLH